MNIRKIFTAILCAAFIAGCGKKEQTATIQNSPPETYKDNVTHFEIQYPGNWTKTAEPGTRAIFYSSLAASYRFVPPFTEGETGAMIEAGASRGNTDSMTKAISDFKSDYTGSYNATFGADSATTLGGAPATKLSYTIPSGKDIIHATRTYVFSDSFYTYLGFGWFDETQAGAQPAFTQAMSAFKPAHILTAAAAAAAAQEASSTTEKTSNEFFTIEYPDNFSVHNSIEKGMLFTSTIRGDRNDCSMQVDVFDAKKLPVQKVFDQNKTKYPNAGSSNDLQIDGNAAKYLNYSPMHDIESRVYFTVKNDKAYRVILNWYKPMQENFLPAFEKCVASLKIK